MALHMRLHDFGKEAMAQMGDEPITLELWATILDGLVDQMLAQRKLFLMHERNQAAMEKMHSEGHEAEHEDIQNRFRQILGDPRVSLRDRVRMAASLRRDLLGSHPGQATPSPTRRAPRWGNSSANACTTSSSDDRVVPPDRPGYASA